jgi:hypothetical protein
MQSMGLLTDSGWLGKKFPKRLVGCMRSYDAQDTRRRLLEAAYAGRRHGRPDRWPEPAHLSHQPAVSPSMVSTRVVATTT